MFDLDFRLCFVFWILAVVVLLYQQKRRGVVQGLGLTFVFLLALSHLSGASINLLPWFSSPEEEANRLGFQVTTIGLISFVVGFSLLNLVFPVPRKQTALTEQHLGPLDRFATVFIVSGIVIYIFYHFVWVPQFGILPTITSVLTSYMNLVNIGFILRCWVRWHQKKNLQMYLWIGLSSILPVFTIAYQGFLGAGAILIFSLVCFVGAFYRPAWRLALILVLMVFFGLSVFVTYSRDKSSIRDALREGSSNQSALERVFDTFSRFEFFDPYDQTHLNHIDNRLNQNILVGKAVQYIGSGAQDFAEGETLEQAVYALIPRVLWPNKPLTAGSGQIVSQYTGMEFAEGTSVGIGTVLEFYINFGTTGVIIGFVCFGLILSLLDNLSFNSLMRGNSVMFAFWYLPGLAFSTVSGALVETTASVAASFVAIEMLARFFTMLGWEQTASAKAEPSEPNPAPQPEPV
ncbi:MAG: hypothetical protein K1Y36_18185 [Blastocatellia bacterium]|nr:hypothetical protein [Blastocatellia bacterium]